MRNRRSFIVASAAALAAAGTARAQAAARLNPNTATAQQLAGVKGLTPALSAAILAKRPYKSMTAFDAVVRTVLSAEQAQAVYVQLFVPINLNTATAEDIALTPGMTRRMVREFLEYRPYSSMAQFDKEIGKYVDPTELARLRSYVTL